MLPLATIGIDTGLSTGWAVLDRDASLVSSGTWRMVSKRERWRVFLDHLLDILGQELFERAPSSIALVYECIRWTQSVDAAHMFGGWQALIGLATHDLGVPLFKLHPQEWKATAAGSGNAKKPEYIAAANQRYGLSMEPSDENEAAAINIAYAGLRKLGGPDLPVSGQQGRLL